MREDQIVVIGFALWHAPLVALMKKGKATKGLYVRIVVIAYLLLLAHGLEFKPFANVMEV